VGQLQSELNQERELKARLRDSIKVGCWLIYCQTPSSCHYHSQREEALRMDAEEGLRLLEEELTRQKKKTKKLKVSPP